MSLVIATLIATFFATLFSLFTTKIIHFFIRIVVNPAVSTHPEKLPIHCLKSQKGMVLKKITKSTEGKVKLFNQSTAYLAISKSEQPIMPDELIKVIDVQLIKKQYIEYILTVEKINEQEFIMIILQLLQVVIVLLNYILQ